MSASAGICATDGCVVRSETGHNVVARLETGHNVVLVRSTAMKTGSVVLLGARGVL